MKTPPGLLFSVILLVVLAAALAGGQVWVITGSTPLGVICAIGTGAGLGLAARPVLRRYSPTRSQFFGEVRGTLEDGEYDDIGNVLTEAGPRGKVRHGANERPERVAESIRTLLTTGAQKKKERR